MKCHCPRHLSGVGDKRKCLLSFGGKTSGKARTWKMKHNIEYSRKQRHISYFHVLRSVQTVNFTLMTQDI